MWRAFVVATLWLVAVLSALALSGCALGNPEGWESRPSRPSLRAEFVMVTVAEVYSICGRYRDAWTHGCAVPDYSAEVCRIFHGPEPQLWLLAHETLHCAGVQHRAKFR